MVAWAITKVLIPLLQNNKVLDFPNSRSSHRVPTPTCGGAGIIAGLAGGLITASLLGMQIPTPPLLLGGVLISLVGFIDDRSGGVSVPLRLTTQFSAAGIVVFNVGGIGTLPLPEPMDLQTGVLAIPLALTWIVAVTNIYNFLDGIDGFAALQGAIAGLCIALLGQGGHLVIMGLVIAGACCGFLLHNWHPAKIFMGDIGSGTLGFLLAALPFQLGSSSSRGDALYAIGMCLWFFLSDASFTILRRIWRGECLWKAHRSHLYQLLVDSGLRHDQVVLRVNAGASIIAALALVSIHISGSTNARWVVIAVAVGAFVAYCFWTWVRIRTLSRRYSEPRTGQSTDSSKHPSGLGRATIMPDGRARETESAQLIQP